jgi:hypothetical protein
MRLSAMILVATIYIGIEVVTTFKLVDGVYYNCVYNQKKCKGVAE